MSPLEMMVELQAWLASLSPAFLFLLLIPFAVAGAALLQYALQARSEARQRALASVETAAADASLQPQAGYAMPRVLIPLDGSENALRAVRHVVNQSLAKGGLEAHLLVVRAPLLSQFASITGKQQREWVQQVLAPAREMLHRYSVLHAVHVDTGERAEAIHRAAQRLRVDKIVMGTARKYSLTRFFQDSVTSRVLEIARVPVELIGNSKVSKLERYGVPAGVGTAVAAVLVAAD
jgi:nucleotide-binding universal stress UspA family protein